MISDLNQNAIHKALTQLKDNRDFIALSTSALARVRADWLYGINMTRLCTLKGRIAGYSGVLSVGRVQTPLLGLIVRRELEIQKFQPKDYYEIVLDCLTEDLQSISAKWVPSKESELYQDEQGRVINKDYSLQILSRVVGKSGKIVNLSQKTRKLAPPLPVNLSFLQIEMAKKYGATAQQVLTSCQSLYERFKLITYPRSDNRYLSLEHYQQRSMVLKTLSNNLPDWDLALAAADLNLKSKAWDDKKIAAHHAIIPTLRQYDIARLPLLEQQVYQMIACYYLAQFYPVHEYLEQQVEIEIESLLFKSKEIKILEIGWKKLFSMPEKTANESKSNPLKQLKKDAAVTAQKGEVISKQTTPPRHFNDASLLSAMTGINRFVTDPIIKKVLLDTDGLGTEATRAGIIELLFKRNYLYRDGKEIKATALGHSLINNLPDSVTTPDMTALWESQLDKIAQKEINYQFFIQELTFSLKKLLQFLANKSFQLNSASPKKSCQLKNDQS